jgi:hypothetical protein
MTGCRLQKWLSAKSNIMKKTAFLFLAAIVLSGCGQKKAEKLRLEGISCTGGNKYSCTFDGVKHDFIVDMPIIQKILPLLSCSTATETRRRDSETVSTLKKKQIPSDMPLYTLRELLPQGTILLQAAGIRLLHQMTTRTRSSLYRWLNICKRSIPSTKTGHTPQASATVRV